MIPLIFRNFLQLNVPQYGNCFTFNSKYNVEDTAIYKKENASYKDTGKRRLSSLTGPSFGLNLIVTLDLINYIKGAITKEVCYSLSLKVFSQT